MIPLSSLPPVGGFLAPKHAFRSVMLTLFSLALPVFGATTPPIVEGFNSGVPTDWTVKNQSSPLGTNTWAQGDPNSGGGSFIARSGANNSYVAADYNSGASVATISNWLISPQRTFNNGDVISFYTRTKNAQDAYADRLELRLSQNGASLNVGSTDTSVGDFGWLLLSVNPTLSPTGYPTAWTKYTVTVAGLSGPTAGRFALRYFVTDGGPQGSNSNYVAIDDLVYSPVGQPTLGTATVSQITESHAGLNVYVVGNGGSAVTEQGVVYAQTFINNNPQIGGTGVSQRTFPPEFDSFQILAESLSPNTSYTFKAFATNASGTAYSAPVTFTTLKAMEPDIEIAKGDASPLSTEVVAWGYNGSGQTNVPFDLFDASSLATGDYHSAAVRPDGTIATWGSTSYGQSTLPPGLANVVAVSEGWLHSVALTADGHVYAWGTNTNHQTEVPAGLEGVIAIAAGYDFSLALKTDGTVVAWGGNGFGQTTVPDGLSGVTAIAASRYVAVALRNDGSVIGWGYVPPGMPEGLTGVQAIAAGDGHVLALMPNGTVIAWGTTSAATVPEGLSDVVSVAAGSSNSFAIKRDGSVVAWGTGSYGNLDLPAGLNGVTRIATGATHTLATRRAILFHSQPLPGDSTTLTFSIQNVGRVPLDVTSVSLVGGNVDDFSLTQPSATSIADGSGQTFTVTFAPTYGGRRTTTLQVLSNDPDEPNLDVAVIGYAIATPPAITSPSITQLTATSATANADVTADGGSEIVERGFVYSTSYSNSMTTLNGPGAVKVVVSGTTGPYSAALSGLTPGTTYYYRPFASTSYTTAYSANSSPLFFTTPALTPPDIRVNPPTGRYFGQVERETTTAPTTFVIDNVGGTDLHISSISITGTNADSYSITSGGGASTIAPAGQGSVAVTFTPLTTGYLSATLTITSDDPDQSSYTLTLGGTGQSVPALTNPAATNPTETSATLGAHLESDGNSTITEIGFIVSTTAANPNPTLGGTGVLKYL
ncbi:MAG: choice-of-anchor J domain-containing protein, partial [Verrucomicrobiales bacterium]|nr:choice-of-anchor J domain-containing protein [Verrucomicrobiales bacterium]